jgi:hypothetical protein
LLKLESLRARRLLKTSNATLAEIEQVESEIRRLRRRLAEVQPAPVTA